MHVRVLDTRPRHNAVAAQRGRIGRVWRTVTARPSRRIAKLERLAALARIDNPDSIVRVR